jgi:hypothetical protein
MAMKRSGWNVDQARDLAAVGLRFIERGDALAAIAALARAIETLVGEVARRERTPRSGDDEVRV